MAQKSYKVGSAIEVVYQTLNAATGKTVNMEVYDETHTLVAGGPIVLTELGASGRYYGTFTPDAAGEWSVQIEEADGTGKVVKAFSVGTHHLQDVGAKVDTIETATNNLATEVGIVEGKVDTIDGEISTIDGKVSTVDSKVDTVDSKVDTVDAKVVDLDSDVAAVDAKIDSLDSDITSIDGKIDGLTSPPMIG